MIYLEVVIYSCSKTSLSISMCELFLAWVEYWGFDQVYQYNPIYHVNSMWKKREKGINLPVIREARSMNHL